MLYTRREIRWQISRCGTSDKKKNDDCDVCEFSNFDIVVMVRGVLFIATTSFLINHVRRCAQVTSHETVTFIYFLWQITVSDRCESAVIEVKSIVDRIFATVCVCVCVSDALEMIYECVSAYDLRTDALNGSNYTKIGV